MGLFKKLKKLVKKPLSLALKTAPIWSSFIPGGGFGMTILKQGLKLGPGLVSPSVKNRFPVPNPIWQGGPVVQQAYAMKATPPQSRRGGPYSSRRGSRYRLQERLMKTPRQIYLRGRQRKQMRMRMVM